MIGWLSATIILGGIFIGGQGLEYWHLFKSGVDVNSNLFATTFFTLTGFHGLHVCVGLIALLVLLGLALGRRLEEAALAGARRGRALLALRRRGLGFCFVRGLHPASTPMSTEQFLLSAWTWNPVVLLAAGAGLAAYLLAFRARRRLGWLLLALAVFLLTLVSPLNALADGYLFSAHMLQHILLLLVVPGFLLLSLPRSLSLRRRPRLLAHPLTGWVAGVGAMWFWHWPTLCNAAVTSRSVHALQTVSLLVLGTLFWSQIIAPRDEERLSPPAAVLYLFSACVACSVLGIIITFSPVTVCSIYTMPVATGSACWRRFEPVGDSRRRKTSRSADC